MFLKERPRRLRYKKLTRELVEETAININNLIYPIFVTDQLKKGKNEIKSMPEIYQHSLNSLIKECEECLSLGVNKILLFGIPKEKDKDKSGSIALSEKGIIQKSLKKLKQLYKDEILIITDLCFCEYTNHGHCGIIKNNQLDNDETLKILSTQALSHIEHGSDILAPSGMLDGMIKHLRESLENNNYSKTPIMSYSSKYASAYYGPFRQAVNTNLKSETRESYQINIKNKLEAYKESIIDFKEGADILMVKPALPYLDIIKELKNQIHLPLAAYQVSGEYSSIKASSKLGYINEKQVIMENIISIKRAGADIIISYFTKKLASYKINNNLIF